MNGGVAQPQARRRRRRVDLDRAEREAGGADALEIHVAREVVAAGPQRRERRRQLRLERDEAADRRRGALAHRERARAPASRRGAGPRCAARAPRCGRCARAPRASRRSRSAATLEAAMRSTGCAMPRGLAASRWQSLRRCAAKPSASGKPTGAAARQNRDRDRRRAQAAAPPTGRLAIGGEIEDDAEAERDRQPGHQPAGRDFGERPLPTTAGAARPARTASAVRQQQAGAPARGVDLAPPTLCARASTLSAPFGHDAPPTLRREPAHASVSCRLWLGERL